MGSARQYHIDKFAKSWTAAIAAATAALFAKSQRLERPHTVTATARRTTWSPDTLIRSKSFTTLAAAEPQSRHI